MPTLGWFLFVFGIGTVSALGLSLLSTRLRSWPWSSRFGCALGGAALGTFVAAMVLLAYPSLSEGVLGHAVAAAISCTFGLAIQKSVCEGRLPILPID